VGRERSFTQVIRDLPEIGTAAAAARPRAEPGRGAQAAGRGPARLTAGPASRSKTASDERGARADPRGQAPSRPHHPSPRQAPGTPG